jgi:hypothetical protein
MASPHFRILNSPARSLRIQALKEDSDLLELHSGDAFLVASAPDGGVLVTLDDVDDSPVPTARLTRLEARRLALVLMRHAGEGRD